MWYKLLILMFVLASFCAAQVDVYGVAGAGTMIRDGKSVFAFAVGANIPIQTSPGFRTYNQTVVKYSDGFGDGEIQEMSMYIMQEKTIGLWTTYLVIGTGAVVEVDDGEDDFDMAMKCELGAEFFWKVGFAIGIEYLPISGEPDRTFLYGSIDLFR